MKIGYRAVFPDEINRHDADLVQVSVYRNMPDSIMTMRSTVSACRLAGVRFVIHPVGYSLSSTNPKRAERDMPELRLMAGLSDLGVIIHDETSKGGGPLTPEKEGNFRRNLKELSSICPVSIENAAHTEGIAEFWRRYARSAVLDIGHIESSGLDSMEFVKKLPDDCIKLIEFVHIHRNNGLRGGLTDHWPLRRDCRELEALKGLLLRKKDLSVILEINETEETGESLALIREAAGSSIYRT